MKHCAIMIKLIIMMNSLFLTKVTFPCNCVSWLLNAVVVVDAAFADLIAKRYDDDDADYDDDNEDDQKG